MCNDGTSKKHIVYITCWKRLVKATGVIVRCWNEKKKTSERNETERRRRSKRKKNGKRNRNENQKRFLKNDSREIKLWTRHHGTAHRMNIQNEWISSSSTSSSFCSLHIQFIFIFYTWKKCSMRRNHKFRPTVSALRNAHSTQLFYIYKYGIYHIAVYLRSNDTIILFIFLLFDFCICAFCSFYISFFDFTKTFFLPSFFLFFSFRFCVYLNFSLAVFLFGFLVFLLSSIYAVVPYIPCLCIFCLFSLIYSISLWANSFFSLSLPFVLFLFHFSQLILSC